MYRVVLKKCPKKCNEHEKQKFDFRWILLYVLLSNSYGQCYNRDIDDMPTSLPKGVYAIVYVLLR